MKLGKTAASRWTATDRPFSQEWLGRLLGGRAAERTACVCVTKTSWVPENDRSPLMILTLGFFFRYSTTIACHPIKVIFLPVWTLPSLDIRYYVFVSGTKCDDKVSANSGTLEKALPVCDCLPCDGLLRRTQHGLIFPMQSVDWEPWQNCNWLVPEEDCHFEMEGRGQKHTPRQSNLHHLPFHLVPSVWTGFLLDSTNTDVSLYSLNSRVWSNFNFNSFWFFQSLWRWEKALSYEFTFAWIRGSTGRSKLKRTYLNI